MQNGLRNDEVDLGFEGSLEVKILAGDAASREIFVGISIIFKVNNFRNLLNNNEMIH